MSRHSFDPEIAKTVGVNAAIIYQNISWWCERNASKSRNIRGGNAWTYNSISTFSKLFQYLSPKQIRTALDRLEVAGLLIVGNFNKDARDRTKWYALSFGGDAFANLVSPHLPHRAETLAREGKPLPVSKPVSKQTPIPPEGDFGFFQEELDRSKQENAFEAEFAEFWVVYPKKAGKPAAKKAFARAITRAPAQIIIERAKALAALHKSPLAKGEFRASLKHPQGWLNDDRWEDAELLKANSISPERKKLQEIIKRNQGSNT